MYRDGVAGERIHGKDVKMLRRLGGERQTRIARSDLNSGLRVSRVTEDVPRNSFHQRVDFIEAENIARTPIGSQRPRPQPDNANTARPVSTTKIYRQPDTGIM